MAKECLFCRFAAGNGARLIYKDTSVFAFSDHSPRATQHLLVLPNEHIEDVKSLNLGHRSLVHHMLGVGNALLEDRGVPPSQRVFGFHVPPFNSMPHLHLHCLGMPYSSFWDKLRYTQFFFGSFIAPRDLKIFN